MRVGPLQHVVDRAALIGNAPKRDDLYAIDHVMEFPAQFDHDRPASSAHDLRLGHRDYEAPSLPAVSVLLFEDLIGEIPDQQEKIVGTTVRHTLGGQCRVVGTR